jgi:hypothetical protein
MFWVGGGGEPGPSPAQFAGRDAVGNGVRLGDVTVLLVDVSVCLDMALLISFCAAVMAAPPPEGAVSPAAARLDRPDCRVFMSCRPAEMSGTRFAAGRDPPRHPRGPACPSRGDRGAGKAPRSRAPTYIKTCWPIASASWAVITPIP